MIPPLYRDSTTLTAVLVSKYDSVAGLVKDKHGFRITAAVRAMASTHAGKSPSAGTPVTIPSARATAPSARATAPSARATAPGGRATTAPAATGAPAG